MKTENKLFSTLQSIGGAFMLPIALLPIAGLLLGIGSSFTNELTIQTYGLESVLGNGTFLHAFLLIAKDTGQIIFSNLPILFAIGVAAGLAQKEKFVAAISGAIGFFVMHQAINTMLALNNLLLDGALMEGALGYEVGIKTMQMGVFGGIIVGLGVAGLHNKFYRIKLPTMLSFFGGTRFIPIITTLVYMFVGILMFYVWGYAQTGISYLGNLVNATGYFGTFIYGCIERALIPFGLHHVFYMPFWQTGVGGTQIIDGISVSGGQNIFFAELASPNVSHFSVEATKYMMGKFPIMLFGIPGAALAMYQTAKPENKKVVAGLLLSATLTCIVTGITEPLEFSFLFVAPLLYVVHTFYAGLSFMLCHLVGGAVGQTFSGSLIDFVLFGIMQGNAKTNWINIALVGVGFFPLYYLTFRFLILKLNLKTPGREEATSDVKLYTKKDYLATKEADAAGQLSIITSGLGGLANIASLTNCASRLRVSVHDEALVDKAKLESPDVGAKGVLLNGKGVQVIFGPQVSIIKSELEDYLENLSDAEH